MFPDIERRTAQTEPDLPGRSPILRRLYGSRGVESVSDLDYGLERLPRFGDLFGIHEAVELLSEAVRMGRRIVVVGDYDADGATSIAVAVRALQGMGAVEVRSKVPNRFTDGYGLTPGIVEDLLPLEPQLLVTVDNGIASVDGVASAKRAGLDVVVTDHHLAGPDLPEANAIVNPNQSADESELGNLAGVGVIFLLMVALRASLRESGWFGDSGPAEPNLADLLDLVALGTVADVVPLDHSNRLLVYQGLLRIRAGRCQPGIKALAEVAGRRHDRLTATDLGFVIGPRLNAAGRLEDMALGVNCLLQDSYADALPAAKELDRLNRERRSIEAKMESEALQALEELDLEEDSELPAGLCLWDDRWHQGVVGILASRLKERTHRPVVAFAPGEDSELRGSARSVRGVHIRDVLENVANTNPGLVDRFGGHAMAAGLTLGRERIEEFRRSFEAEVERVYPLEDRRNRVLTDGELREMDLGLDLAREIRAGGPWGTAFPEPVFDGRFDVLDRRIVGERHLKMKLRPTGGTRTFDAIAFRHTDEEWPPGGQPTIEAVYQLDVNEYRGVEKAQLLVRDLRLV